MRKLNLPSYTFKVQTDGGKELIYDFIRKKYVVLTPEEWVRQNFIQYLIHEKNYPASLMAVEKKLMVNHQPQRFDLLIYNRKGQARVIVEFKAPSVKVTQETFDQAVRYNMALKVKYILISNGMQHFACEIDYEKNSYTFLQDIPGF
ncbi:type I restriction enzyme HsdR N-terminal domain-containing protein [Maribellus maritimus]|uniref:type I restriction enzyme HsdR N-terminal domain-containing protein n=1 Tax=Maribellus maritimus TaxID=2870838 RepID=UPI001EECB3F9|nr:type I restriction enzyme HsdR N-terminal domain-containing protein [Maribellus maritimus]MCG6186450.1 type I restriction enzyme HsdR N-terminal domain-containing protein [Maribellus maritimus]